MAEWHYASHLVPQGPVDYVVKEVLEVSLPKRGRFTRVDQLLACVLADRLEHRVSRGAAELVHHHERLVDEMREQIKDGRAVDAFTGTDSLRRLEGPTPDKDGYSPKQDTLRVVQQVVAPVNERAQRLLSRDHGSTATGEEPESVVEPPGNLSDRENSDPGCRKLERQRNAVETAADPNDVGCVLLGQRKRRLIGSAAVDEQGDRLVLAKLIERRGSVIGGRARRRHSAQRLPRPSAPQRR